ncbi:MAG TPA: DUF4157 domain-containing protein [Rudaea sp.]|nr:DUF4157 domain-containing protein [Rudaea sp.]
MFELRRSSKPDAAPAVCTLGRVNAADRAHQAAAPAWNSRHDFDLTALPAAVQLKATIGSPNDPLEREADAAAERVMRMTAPGSIGSSSPAIQRKCSACEDDEQRRIQTKRVSAASGLATRDSAAAERAVAHGGAPLPSAARTFFEPRFGHDFSQVRVHTDATAANAARALDAQAYTLGHNIAFAPGAYAPHTGAGRSLLAHELAHVVQQQGGHAGRVQRKLTVDAKASDDPATAVSTIAPLVAALCPDFEILGGGLVWPKKGTNEAAFNFKKVATGKQPLGCCCLSTLSAAPDDWRVVVSTKDAPQTDSVKREVRMTPTSGATAPDLRYWTGGPTETIKNQPPAEAFGHELCGHAALMQIKAHPSSLSTTPDRAFSDIHDPTVRIQDALAKEMGLPGDRGLAGSGKHRGESLRVFTIGPYAADADDPSPFAAQITNAVAFLNGNADLLVDAVGFRNAKDTKASVSLDRATRAQAEVRKTLATPTVDVQTTATTTDKLTRAQPATDGGVGTGPIVELRMAIRPAGLVKSVGTAPPATPVHVDPEFPGVVKALKAHTGPNACHDLLADQGWP